MTVTSMISLRLMTLVKMTVFEMSLDPIIIMALVLRQREQQLCTLPKSHCRNLVSENTVVPLLFFVFLPT